MKNFFKKCIIKILDLFGLKKKFLVYPIFKENIYSQDGEDGIIEYILKKVPDLPRFVLDIGANDGIYCSNSRLLISKYNFEGLLIEAYDEAFRSLAKLYENNPSILISNKAVGTHDGKGLINWHGRFKDVEINIYEIIKLLTSFRIPTIDIDGHDDDILRKVDWKKFSPWFVISEIDSSCSENLQNQIDIMEVCGYYPLYHIGNVFYVRKDISGKFLFKNTKTILPFEKGLFWR